MRNISCGAVIILSSLCGSAHAVPVSESLLGTVSSGAKSIDTGGLFGPVGASLAGDTIDVTFAYDSSRFFQSGTGFFLSQGAGALSIGASINGRSLSIQNSDPTVASSIFIVGPTSTWLNTSLGSDGLAGADIDLTTSPTSTITSIVAQTGSASLDYISFFLPAGPGSPFLHGGDTLAFTLTPAIAVPESGSLALLVTGLLGLGTIARRRRHGSSVTPMGILPGRRSA